MIESPISGLASTLGARFHSPAERWSAPGLSEGHPRTAVVAGLGGLAPQLIAELESHGVASVSADSAREMVLSLGQLEPDLVVMGEGLDRDPVELLEGLGFILDRAVVLFVMDTAELRRAMELLTAGAHDVLLPRCACPELLFRARLARLRSFRLGSVASSPPPHIRGPRVLRIDRRSRALIDSSPAITLTRRELQLLEVLIGAEGEVVRRDQLLQAVWGKEDGSEAVLDATIHRLRQKLEADPSAPELLMTVRGLGYRVGTDRVEFFTPPVRQVPMTSLRDARRSNP
jgi:DNA-binding response OmpR family regulator